MSEEEGRTGFSDQVRLNKSYNYYNSDQKDYKFSNYQWKKYLYPIWSYSYNTE